MAEQSQQKFTPRFTLRLSSQPLSDLSLPLIPVLIPALAHFTLATLALTTVFAGSIVYSHVALLLVTLWATLDRKRWESVAAFMFVLTVSGLADIILLGVSFTQFNTTPSMRFGAAMIIINLLGKPVSLVLSVLALYSRRSSFQFSLIKEQLENNMCTSNDYLEAQPYSQPIPSQHNSRQGIATPYETGSGLYEPQSYYPADT